MISFAMLATKALRMPKLIMAATRVNFIYTNHVQSCRKRLIIAFMRFITEAFNKV